MTSSTSPSRRRSRLRWGKGSAVPDRRPATLWVVGLSHHTADAGRRGQVARTPDGVRALLQRARAHAALAEVLVLSTCTRVEFYVVSADPPAAERTLRLRVERRIDVEIAGLRVGLHEERPAPLAFPHLDDLPGVLSVLLRVRADERDLVDVHGRTLKPLRPQALAPHAGACR